MYTRGAGQEPDLGKRRRPKVSRSGDPRCRNLEAMLRIGGSRISLQVHVDHPVGRQARTRADAGAGASGVAAVSRPQEPQLSHGLKSHSCRLAVWTIGWWTVW